MVALPAPVIVKSFLSDSDVEQIFAFGLGMQVQDGGGLVRYGDAHVALFLHHGGMMYVHRHERSLPHHERSRHER